MPMLRWLAPQIGDVLAVDADLAGGRRLEAGDHAQRRRLAAAAGPEERDELAALDRELEVLDHRVGAEGLADAVEFEEGHGGSLSACRRARRAPRRRAESGPCRPR